jgi:hypothetical protein
MGHRSPSHLAGPDHRAKRHVRWMAFLVAAFAGAYALMPSAKNPARPADKPSDKAAAAQARGAVTSFASSPSTAAARLEGVVVADIPMLRGQSPEQRLQTLRWMLKAPGGKIVSLFPDLRTAGQTSYYERESMARERIEGEISRLERGGVRAPEASSSVAIARIEKTTWSPEILSALQAGP